HLPAVAAGQELVPAVVCDAAPETHALTPARRARVNAGCSIGAVGCGSNPLPPLSPTPLPQRERGYSGSGGLAGLQEVLGEALQDAAGLVDRDLFVGIQAAAYRHLDTLAVAAGHHQGEGGAGLALADDVVGLGAVQAQADAVTAGQELQRQHAHADQVGAVDALEALGDDGLDAGQAYALGSPVAAGTLAVVGAGDDDQRLAALHVGLDRLPHARHPALRLDACQRTLAHAAILVAHHLVEQLRVGEGGALRGQVVAAVGGVGIEVLFRQAHLRQVFAGGAARQDGVAGRDVVGGDVVAEDRQRPH